MPYRYRLCFTTVQQPDINKCFYFLKHNFHLKRSLYYNVKVRYQTIVIDLKRFEKFSYFRQKRIFYKYLHLSWLVLKLLSAGRGFCFSKFCFGKCLPSNSYVSSPQVPHSTRPLCSVCTQKTGTKLYPGLKSRSMIGQERIQPLIGQCNSFIKMREKE